MKAFLTSAMLMSLLSLSAHAKVTLTKHEYTVEGKTFEGIFAVDDTHKGKRPGIVVFHNWMGVSAETESKITELAKLGYVAFAADIFGKGIRPKDQKEASELATKYRNDRALLKSHAGFGLDQLSRHSRVDKTKLFASGYCFGGTTALELGRGGSDLLGIVSFHGGLTNPVPADAKNIKGEVAIFHGAVDPYVPEAELMSFKKEMDEAKVKYQITMYSGAVHSFTEKSAGNDPSKGAAYNEVADKRSWEAMKEFLGELSKK